MSSEESQHKQQIKHWLELLDDSLEIGGIVELPVLSDSMMPIMVPGRMIKIQRACRDQCSPGDIIVFRDGQKLTAHRLLFSLRVGGVYYCFQKGDANPYGQLIRAERVIGRVIESQDAGGNYINLSSKTSRPKARVVTPGHFPKILWGCVLQVLRRYSVF